jgi:hypothetical protein
MTLRYQQFVLANSNGPVGTTRYVTADGKISDFQNKKRIETLYKAVIESGMEITPVFAEKAFYHSVKHHSPVSSYPKWLVSCLRETNKKQISTFGDLRNIMAPNYRPVFDAISSGDTMLANSIYTSMSGGSQAAPFGTSSLLSGPGTALSGSPVVGFDTTLASAIGDYKSELASDAATSVASQVTAQAAGELVPQVSQSVAVQAASELALELGSQSTTASEFGTRLQLISEKLPSVVTSGPYPLLKQDMSNSDSGIKSLESSRDYVPSESGPKRGVVESTLISEGIQGRGVDAR